MRPAAEPDGAAVWDRLAGAENVVWAEDKFNGLRAQVHVADGRCEIFAGDLQCVTARFPEIVRAMARWPGSLVLDGEILVPPAGRHLPFFDGRKLPHGHEADLFSTENFPVEFVAFDVLRHGGVTLLAAPWRERRAVLGQLELPRPLSISVVARLESAAAVEVEFLAARARGNEGLVCKDPTSTYRPGWRGGVWIKLQKE